MAKRANDRFFSAKTPFSGANTAPAARFSQKICKISYQVGKIAFFRRISIWQEQRTAFRGVPLSRRNPSAGTIPPVRRTGLLPELKQPPNPCGAAPEPTFRDEIGLPDPAAPRFSFLLCRGARMLARRGVVARSCTSNTLPRAALPRAAPRIAAAWKKGKKRNARLVTP